MIQASQIAAALSGTARVGSAEETPQRSGAAARRPNIVGMEARQPLDQSGEGAALSAAIQRLIRDRDRHKSLAAAQESELVRLNAINQKAFAVRLLNSDGEAPRRDGCWFVS